MTTPNRLPMARRLALTGAAWGCVALAVAAPEAFAQADTASPAKKELIAKILKLQQPVIEGLAQSMAEQPAAQLMQQAGLVLQTRVPPEKREEVGNGIKADVKKYLDEVSPVMKEKAVRVAPGSVGVLLDEKFTEDELKQLIDILESPINRRLQEMGGDIQRALRDKLVTDARGDVEPKVRALQQSVAQRLGADSTAAKKPATPAKPTGK